MDAILALKTRRSARSYRAEPVPRRIIEDTVDQMLKVPAGFKLIGIVALGYAAATPPMPKRPLTEVLHWESF